MSYCKIPVEVERDENRKIRFEISGFANFTDELVVEMSKLPKKEFEETSPCELTKQLIKIPHIHFLLYYNMLLAIGYSYHFNDVKNNPNEKLYYKCYRHFLHHDDIMLKQHERFTPMLIEELIKVVIDEKWDMQMNYQDH